MSVILKKPWKSQPQVAVKLRRTPITRGIIAVSHPLFARQTDFVGGKWTVGAGTYGIAGSTQGKAFSGNMQLLGPSINVSNPFTCLIVTRSPPVLVDSLHVGASASIFWMGTNTSNQYVISHSGSPDTVIGAATINEDIVFAARRRASFFEGWINGVAGGNTTTNLPTGAGVCTVMDYSSTLGLGWANMALSIWWDRCLDDGEMLSISKDPWQIFEPLTRVIFTPSTVVSGGIAGTASLTFGQAASLSGSGSLLGISDNTFGAGSSILRGAASVAGATSLTFGGTNVLNGSGSLAGASALVLGATSTALGAGALAGASTNTINGSATLTLPSGSIAGAVALQLNAAATATGSGALSGIMVMVFGASLASAISGAVARFRRLGFGFN